MQNFAKIVLALVIAVLLLPACSREESEFPEDGGEEKGKIEEMTSEAAATVVKKVRTPLDKARAASNLGNSRVEEMDKAVQDQ